MSSKAISTFRPIRAALPFLFTLMFFLAALFEMYNEQNSLAFTLILFGSSLFNALVVKTRVRKLIVTGVMVLNGAVFLLLAGKYFDSEHDYLFYAWGIGLLLAIFRGLYSYNKYTQHLKKKKDHEIREE